MMHATYRHCESVSARPSPGHTTQTTRPSPVTAVSRRLVQAGGTGRAAQTRPPHHRAARVALAAGGLALGRRGRGRGSAGPTSGRRLVGHRLVARACLGGWELLACLGLGVGGWDWEDAPAALGPGRLGGRRSGEPGALAAGGLALRLGQWRLELGLGQGWPGGWVLRE